MDTRLEPEMNINSSLSYMDNLPLEIQEKIISYLDFAHMSRLRSVNHTFNHLAIKLLNKNYFKLKEKVEKLAAEHFAQAKLRARLNVVTLDPRNFEYFYLAFNLASDLYQFHLRFLRCVYLRRLSHEIEPTEFVFINGKILDWVVQLISVAELRLKTTREHSNYFDKCRKKLDKVIEDDDSRRPLTSDEKMDLKQKEAVIQRQHAAFEKPFITYTYHSYEEGEKKVNTIFHPIWVVRDY